MNEIHLKYVSIHYSEPIVYFVYKEGAELGFPEIRELISYAEQLSAKKPYVTFADVRVNLNITNEGKRVLQDMNNMPYFRGTAVLVKNSIHKFAVEVLNSFHKPAYPFRAFTSKEKAIEWLSSLPLNQEQ
jgi:hypothetical protein